MARPALGLARPELEEAAEVEEPTSGSGAGDSGKRAIAGETAMAVAC